MKLSMDEPKPSDGIKDIVGIDSGTPRRIAALIDRIFGVVADSTERGESRKRGENRHGN
jgi:hypothetical protein